MNLRPGTTLSHYRLLEELGHGGMGVVYKAYDTRLEREVAVKVLHPGSLDDPRAQRRFRQEALALSRLNHPHVQTVFEVDRVDDVDFLVTEYIPGAVLHSLTATGPLPERSAAELGLQIAEALGAAHERGVVHRDLSGNNVLVTDGNQVKIVDFGLALVNKPVTDTQTTEALSESVRVAGTLPYMSPEQLRGEADPRSDIYAAGVLLYELATGHLPFENLPAPALVAAIQSSSPLPPRDHNHHLSSRMEEILLKCLEKTPGRRYQSANELAVDLRRVIDPWPVEQIRRHRLAGSLTLAALIVVVTGVALGLTGRLGGRTPERFRNPHMSEVVSWPGEASSALISPDDQWIAFLSDHSGRPGLWRRHVSGGDPAEIVTDAGNIVSYAWSPTGTEMVYLHLMGGAPTLKWVSPFGGRPIRTRVLDSSFANAGIVRWAGTHVYLSIDSGGLWRLGPDSAAPSKILDVESPNGLRSRFDVSPDETKVAYTIPRNGVSAVWTANIDGSGAVKVTPDGVSESTPRWAGQDDRFLMVVSDRSGQPDIWCRDLRRGTARQVTFSSSEEILDDVSLDGSMVVFSQAQGSGNLWTWRGAESHPETHRLTLGAELDLWPTVAGNLVAFQRSGSETGTFWNPYHSDIYLTRTDRSSTENDRLVVKNGGLPTLSPEGDAIAFVRSAAATGGWELWLHDLVRDQEYRLAADFQAPRFYLNPLVLIDRNLAWSPDEKTLYYVAITEQGRSLRAVEKDGGSYSVRTVVDADPGVSMTDLALSPEGGKIALLRIGEGGGSPGEIAVVNPVSGESRTRYALPAATNDRLTLVDWFPTGDRLLALRARFNADWTQDLDVLDIGPDETVVRGRIDHAVGCTARLDRAGKALYLIKTEEDRPGFNLYAFHFPSGTLSPVTGDPSPSASFAGMEVLDDGALLYSRIEWNEGIWMIQFDR